MYLKGHLSLVDAILCVIAGLVLMFLVYQDFDPRFLIFTALAMVIAEIFIRVRWRVAIACHRCGFDPVLYKRKPALAAAKVKAFLDGRKDDPLALLTPPPKLPALMKSKSPPREAPKG